MKFLLTCFPMVAICLSARAASIGVSFAGGSGGGTDIQIFPVEVAGVIPQSNWNEANGAGGGPIVLNNSAGDPTSASVSWTSANTWGGNIAETEDEWMVNGWLDDGGGSGASVSIMGIPYAFYDVYVYGSSDVGNQGRGFVTNVNGTEYLSGGLFTNLTINNSFFDGSNYVDASTSGDNPSYHLISNISGPNLIVLGARTVSGGVDYRGPISGIQIVERIPEPSSTVLLIASLIGAVGFRRRK